MQLPWVKTNLKLIAIILLIAVIAVTLVFYKSKPDVYYQKGTYLVKVEGYKHVEPGQVACQALIAECGYCPGEVINKECWVPKK